MRRVALIVNPHASRVTPELTQAVKRELGRVAEVSTLSTEGPGHAAELAAGLTGVDAIVIYSGDGGFNETLNGVERPDVPVGFLPGGGTSVLPRALGRPRDPVRAAARVAEALEAGRSRTVSLGRVNGRRFAFSAGLGIDAEAVRRVDAMGRSPEGRRPGDLAFIRAIASIVLERRGRFDPVLELADHGRAAFLFVSNVDPYSFARALAIRPAPEAMFEAGLDFMAPIRVRPATIPLLLFALATGRRVRGALTGHDLDRLEVRCDAPTPLQADGEDLGDVTEATFEAERAALRVLA